MNLPFTADQFLEVFRTYNQTIWPAQMIILLIALFLVLVVFRRTKNYNIIISGGLGLFWMWMGFVYHILFFTKINPAAYLFGALFIVQGLLFIYYGIMKKQLTFKYENNLTGIMSLLMFLYALIFYPLLGYYFGHTYPATPTFGLPCPTTIFTFGLLVLLERRKIVIHIIPLIWSVIGFTAALKLGIYQDVGLLVVGIIAFIVLMTKKYK
jgi:hypothetical protein